MRLRIALTLLRSTIKMRTNVVLCKDAGRLSVYNCHQQFVKSHKSLLG